MHRPVPQELVEMIIDYVGGCGHNLDHTTIQALENCAVVAKSWTHRSRTHLFKEIMVNVDSAGGFFNINYPSRYFLTLIKSLKMVFHNNDHPDRGGVTMHLLTMFSESPLESIQIEGGGFFLEERSAIRAHFDLLSGRLLKIAFSRCLFDPEPLRDILSIRNLKADITFKC